MAFSSLPGLFQASFLVIKMVRQSPQIIDLLSPCGLFDGGAFFSVSLLFLLGDFHSRLFFLAGEPSKPRR